MSKRSEQSATDQLPLAQRRVLARQRSILLHLTQPSKYLEAAGHPLAAGLVGLDLARLRLVAELALAKRMRKIGAVLPATVRCVADRAPRLLPLFAERCPPLDFSRFFNAMQFHDFLTEVTGTAGNHPAYLRDLVRCEFAVARAGREQKLAEESPAAPVAIPLADAFRVRVRPDVAIIEFRYAVRSLLENPTAAPPRAVAESPGTIAVIPAEAGPRTLQIDPGIHQLLLSLVDWTTLTVEPAADGALIETLRQLAAHGLIQVSTCDSA